MEYFNLVVLSSDNDKWNAHPVDRPYVSRVWDDACLGESGPLFGKETFPFKSEELTACIGSIGQAGGLVNRIVDLLDRACVQRDICGDRHGLGSLVG